MSCPCPRALPLVLMLAGACAAREDRTPAATVAPVVVATEPERVLPPSDEVPVLEPADVATVSSVQLNQDCPDSAERSDRAEPSATRGRRQKGEGPISQPCTQSTAQLAFSAHYAGDAKVVLKEVRLLGGDGAHLATLTPRLPTQWKDVDYQAWDEVLPQGQALQASYRLSTPDWKAVEIKLGSSSYGVMYTLEIDVEVAGTLSTIASPEFERGRVEILRT